MIANPKRMWVNQPSALQPLHHYHGTLVLAVPYTDESMAVYFLDGETSSAVLPRETLSDGWPQHLRQSSVAPAEDVEALRGVLSNLVGAVRSEGASPEREELVQSLCAQADEVLGGFSASSLGATWPEPAR